MKGVGAVIHSAAMVSFVKKDRKQIYQINKEGTSNVVNVALENNIPRFVHISSIAALGRTASGDHVNEEKKWAESRLNTHYAKSKMQAELEVWRAAGEGLNVVIANPSTILGYGDWHSGSSAIFKRIYQQFPWYTNGINGFVDVEDCARAIVRLMESGISEQRFILNADNWTFCHLFTNIANAFGKKPPSKEATALLSSIAWRMEKLKSIFTGARPLLTKESARIGQSKTFFENKKLLAALPGFSFTPLEESIKKACKKYEEAIKKGLLKL
jgi:nucleoside-diphosphate-sugar epimerase